MVTAEKSYVDDAQSSNIKQTVHKTVTERHTEKETSRHTVNQTHKSEDIKTYKQREINVLYFIVLRWRAKM